MAVKYIWSKLIAGCYNGSSLRPVGARGMGYRNDGDGATAQFTDDRRRTRILLEERDHSDIVALPLLADRQRVNHSLKPPERGGSEKMENPQKNPASRSRKPLRERPFGMFKRGIAWDSGAAAGIHPPSTRKDPMYPTFAAML